jgi:hypothetical protein
VSGSQLWRAGLALVFLGLGVAYSVTEGADAGIPGIPSRALELVSSPGFLTFVIMTGWLAFGLMDTRTSHRETRLIRLGSYRRLLLAVVSRSALLLATPTAIVVTAVVVAAILPGTRALEGRVTPVVEASGIPILVAFLLQACFVALFLLVWRVLVECVAVIAPYWVVVTATVVVWLWAAGSAAGFASPGPADFLSYVVLVQLRDPFTAGVVALTYAALIAAAVGCVTALDSAGRRLPTPSTVTLAFLVACATVFLATGLLLDRDAGLAGTLVTVFYGPTGNLLTVLIGIVVVVGYVYFASLRIAHRLGGWESLRLIRYGSRGRSVTAFALGEVVSVLAYVVCVTASASTAFFLFGGLGIGLSPALVTLCVVLLVVTACQIMFYVACVFFVTDLSGDARAGLIAVGVAVAVAAIPLPPSWIVPVQRSGTAVVFDGGLSVAIANALLLVICTLVVFVLSAILPRQHRPTRLAGSQQKGRFA